MLRKKKTDLAAAFRDTRAAALEQWRTAVKDHAAGRPVDLADLIAAAPMVGVTPTSVAEAFAADVEAYERDRQNEATVATEERLFREAEAAVPSPAEVEAARQRLDELMRASTAPRWTAEGLAHARGDAARHRRQHPRLWNDLHEHDAPAAAAALQLPEPAVQPEPVAAAAAPFSDGESADWLPDDD